MSNDLATVHAAAKALCRGNSAKTHRCAAHSELVIGGKPFCPSGLDTANRAVLAATPLIEARMRNQIAEETFAIADDIISSNRYWWGAIDATISLAQVIKGGGRS